MRENQNMSSLPIELLAATRDKHRTLNIQILNKLPLSIPPASSSPILYAKGMTVFGQIYYAFETHLIASMENENLDERLQDIYSPIYLPRLLRTARLRRDIEIIKMRLGGQGQQELDDLAERSAIYQQRILASLSTKPHVLLAYTWTMYLALFNGGRWMRSQLFSAGPSFWLGQELPLSFWDFEDSEGAISNGEDLKVAFKEGFAQSAASLNNEQREEIIEESKILFDLCSEMVSYMDEGAQLIGTDSFSNHGAAANRKHGVDNNVRASSMVVPVWHYVASMFGSVATSAATLWRRKEISSD
jgi:heme oxygenase